MEGEGNFEPIFIVNTELHVLVWMIPILLCFKITLSIPKNPEITLLLVVHIHSTTLLLAKK